MNHHLLDQIERDRRTGEEFARGEIAAGLPLPRFVREPRCGCWTSPPGQSCCEHGTWFRILPGEDVE
jgi:hypothetical protein